jgi:hypothetical protein
MILVLSLDALVDLYLDQEIRKIDLSQLILWLVSVNTSDPYFSQLERVLLEKLKPISSEPEADAKAIVEVVKNAANNGRLIWRANEHMFVLKGGFQQLMSYLGYNIIGEFVTTYQDAKERIQRTNPDLEVLF